MATRYNVSKIQQLIDLNGSTTNFDINFKVVSENKQPFQVIVADQSTIDNNPNLAFQTANGEISGQLTQDKNIYQNYFLILKSEQPCVCLVEINKKEIPA
mgnify:CR=1 FL=1